MSDKTTTVEQLKSVMGQFVREREWDQFHIPKNLSMALAGEAAELMELLLWVDNEAAWESVRKNKDAIEQELADVLSYVLAFANACDIDLSESFLRKMKLNKQKYPAEKVKSRYDKYTTYQESE